MIEVVLILVLPLSVLQTCFAQENLLLNGGFEELTLANLKNTVIDGHFVKFSNSQDTSRLWPLLSKQKKKSPVSSKYWNFSKDSFSYSNPTFYSNTGNSYKGYVFGLISPFWQASESTYYISNLVGMLCKPLEKDNIYELSFWIWPFEGNYYLDELSIHFSDIIVYRDGYAEFKHKKRERKLISPLINLDAHCKIKLGSRHEDGYREVKCIYKAKGGEIYVYIGNLNGKFPEKSRRKDLSVYGLERSRFSVPVCKYAIDEVSLTSMTDTSENCFKSKVDTVKNVEQVNGWVQEKLWVQKELLKQEKYYTIIVNFNTNSCQLQKKDREYLVTELSRIDTFNMKSISIIGHTDDVGSQEENLKLSYDRANEIKKVIVSIFSDNLYDLPPISVLGKSSSEPIFSEKNDYARSKNRRVEIKISY